MDLKQSKKRIAIILLTSMVFVSFCPTYAFAIDGSDSAQNVVNYFQDVFDNDWEYGWEYDESQGLGYAQSRDLLTSGYKDYSVEPKTVSGQMKITPILSPDTSLSLTVELINSATSTIEIEQMYFKSNLYELEVAITSAEGRGVSVRIIVDESGSYDDHLDPLNSLSGVSVRVSRSAVEDLGNYFDTQHNKGIIVDSKKVLIASINWSEYSLKYNREAGIIVENTEVAEYYLARFNYDWSVSEDLESDHFEPSSSSSTPSVSYTNQFSSETYEGEMTVSCLVSPDNCFETVNNLLASAEKSIDISVYTLSSPYLMDTIVDRIENGVSVRILLEEQQVSAYEQNYNKWTMHNFTVINDGKGKWASSSEGHDKFSYQHSKYAIVDEGILIISSGNWGRSSCPKPREPNDGDGYTWVDGNRDWWMVVYGSGVKDKIGEYIKYISIIIIGIISIIVIIKKIQN